MASSTTSPSDAPREKSLVSGGKKDGKLIFPGGRAQKRKKKLALGQSKDTYRSL